MRCHPVPRHRQRGIAAVEFAFMLSFVLVPVTFGATELGRASFQYNTLTKAVRDAARFASTVAPGTRVLETKCLAITGAVSNNGTSCTAPLLMPGLTLANVVVCDRTTAGGNCNLQPVVVSGTTRGTANLVIVTIQGQAFTSLVSAIVPSFIFGPISATFTVKA